MRRVFLGVRRDRRTRVLMCVQNLSVPRDPRVWREARDLAAAGHEVMVVCPGGPGLARRETIDSVEIQRYPPPPALPGFLGQLVETLSALAWTVVLTARARLRGPIDVLHAANPPDTFFLIGLLLRPFGTRFVFDQHDVCPELLLVKAGHRWIQHRLLRLLELCSYRTADLVIVPNRSYRELALQRGRTPPERVVIVRSGPDQVNPGSLRQESSPPIVAFAGTMARQDGVHVLLEAVAELLGRRPGCLRLDMIGTGDELPALQHLAARLGITDSVTWPGWLEGDEFHRRLGSATVAVSPDTDNPFTRLSTMIKVSDYLGLGLACVVADLPENRATASDAVLYFRPGDAHHLATRLEELLEDPSARDELARRARERAPQLLWDHGRRDLVAAYDALTRNGKRP